MGKLQKVILGTPPKGSDGDPVRVANSKANANVDVLDRQSALVSAPIITASRTLGEEHIGRRVSINIAAGGTIKLRKASLCEPDSIVWLVNVGTKRVLLAPDDGSGDSVSVSGVGAGEAVALDTDGVNAWRVLVRARAASDDETVIGELSVGGNVSAAGGIKSAAANALRSVQGKYGVLLRNDGATAYLLQTKAGDPEGQWNDYRPFSWGLSDGKVSIDGSGAGCAIGSRPTFAGNVAWDSGNMTRPATFSVLGGNEGDLNPNGWEVRLSVNVVCGAGGTMMATATVAVGMAAGVNGNVDAVAIIRIVDGPTLVYDSPDDMATIMATDAGMGGRGKLVPMLSVSGLVPRKAYTLQLLIRKNQPVGPLYPKFMRIAGITA